MVELVLKEVLSDSKVMDVYNEWLNLTRARTSVTYSYDRYEYVASVQNVLLAQEDEILPVLVTTPRGIGEGIVEGTLRKRRDEYSLLTASMELQLRRVREENSFLAAAVIE